MGATQAESRQRADLSLAQPMVNPRRSLQVFINGVRVGKLHDGNSVWSFTYEFKWVCAAGGYAITPGIPMQKRAIIDSGTTRPVQRYFRGLLPDDRALTAFAELAKIDRDDTFLLLAYCGAKSSGYHLGDYPRFVQFCPAPNALELAASVDSAFASRSLNKSSQCQGW